MEDIFVPGRSLAKRLCNLDALGCYDADCCFFCPGFSDGVCHCSCVPWIPAAHSGWPQRGKDQREMEPFNELYFFFFFSP